MQAEHIYPKLRWPIDLRLEKIDSSEILLISCPLGIADQPLGLVAAVAPIVAAFDGTRNIDDITASFSQYGVSLPMVKELVRLLDEGLFLASPRFFAAEREMKESFSLSDKRPAALAGGAYPTDPAALMAKVDGYLNAPLDRVASEKIHGEMLALVAPHIDYRRGGSAYGAAYRNLRFENHDLYILLGTAHQYSRHMFHLTRKDFQGPLGELACDKSFVRRLASLYGADRGFADEILHRREHSLELQTPFLKRLKPNAEIVPILVGGFHHLLSKGSPSVSDEYESFAGSLAMCVREEMAHGRRVCFIAGVDMAHVGRSFGDSGTLSPDVMREVEERDALYLDTISRQDKQAMFAHIAEDGDKRRICGFPTMYTLLDVLDRLQCSCGSELFEYGQAVNYDTDCAVTFAGMALYRKAA